MNSNKYINFPMIRIQLLQSMRHIHVGKQYNVKHVLTKGGFMHPRYLLYIGRRQQIMNP